MGKMFNVAIDKRSDGTLKASFFDFGTTFPCEYIHEEVYGTNAYHPWEVCVESHLCHAPASTDELVEVLYGIEHRAPDCNAQWKHLLFPMGEMKVKQRILDSLDPEQHAEHTVQQELKTLMKQRCQDEVLFGPIID